MKKAVFTPALLFDTPALYGAQVSPDLNWIAWSWGNIDATAQVWLARLDGSQPPVQITDVDEDVWVASWAPDSRGLVLKHDHNGNERMHLFFVSVDELHVTRPLTELAPDFYIHGGVMDPSHRFLVYGANYDFEHALGIEQTFVYRHDLLTQERKVLARPEKAALFHPYLNKAGTHVLYSRSDENAAGEQLWLVDIEGKQDEEIVNVGTAKKVSGSWFPDDDRIVCLAEADGYRKVGVWDLAERNMSWLLDDPSRNIEAAYVPYGSTEIVLVEVVAAEERLSSLDPLTGAKTALALPRFSRPLARLPDGSWVVRIFSSCQPDDLVVVSAAGEVRSITGFWDRVGYVSDDLSRAHSLTWQSIDGELIQGWLYRPKGEPKGAILMVHGGPTGHSEDRFGLDIQYLVANGFVVLDPNYRGSTGFGLEFQESIKKEGWGGSEQDDILAGAQMLIDRAIVKPGTIGITGTSYGGYSSWCAITRAPRELIAAAAPICGMTDLVVDYNSTRPDLRGYNEEMLGGTPDDLPDLYRERSPIEYVKQIKGELLIIQGGMDPNVTPENVVVVEEALKKHEIPYELLLFPDEGHGVYRRRNIETLLRRLNQFFGRAFASQSPML